MPMNLVIQEKRKELGFTQEQVAEYLNVSIPAVSKWENGATSPDISLLPQLARLLKIDLNTLFCFQEDMSQQEIECFCREIAELVRTKGMASGFAAAEQKICEYPHNETLLHCLTFQLDGLLVMSGLPEDEVDQYDARLIKWYHRLAGSNDSKISNSANFMLVNRWIRSGDYDKAQEILDSMPDKEEAVSSMADKRMLQVNLFLCRGETENALKCLQNALLLAVSKVQMLLCRMVDAELADGRIQAAKEIADKASQSSKLFDLWEYNSLTAPLQVAVAEKNTSASIDLLQKMFAAMCTPWDMSSSPLFCRIAKSSGQKQMSPAMLLPAMLSELEKPDPAYAFLQNCDEYKELISEYKAWMER